MLFIQTEAVLFKTGLEVFSALALKLGGGEGLQGTHLGISEHLMLLHWRGNQQMSQRMDLSKFPTEKKDFAF